jgi:hypothetical protein
MHDAFFAGNSFIQQLQAAFIVTVFVVVFVAHKRLSIRKI